MSAATIPLMYNPATKLDDPMQKYGQMLALKGMQAQQQQQQQLAPLVYQREKSANDMQQLQLQQAQAQMQQSQDLANAMRDAATGRGEYAPRPAPGAPSDQVGIAGANPEIPPDTGTATTSARNFNVPAAVTSPAQPQPLSSLAATDGTAPITSSARNLMQPFGAPATAAPASVPATAAKPTAAVSGRPTSQPLDMLSVLDNEFQQGRIGLPYYLQAKKGLVEDREQLAKMHTADLDEQAKQSAGLLKRYDAFLQMPQAYQEKNWIPMNLQAQKDGLMSAEHYSQLLQQYPELPDDNGQTLESMRTGLQGRAGQVNEAIKMRQLANENLTGMKTAAELPETQAKADQAQAASAAQNVLAFTDSPASYSAALDRLRASNPALASRFPNPEDVFDENNQPRPEAVNQIRSIGMNPEQQNAADISRSNAARTANYQNQQLLLSGERNATARQRLAIEQQRADQAPGNRNSEDKTSMGQVWNDTVAAMQGRGVKPADVTPQDAINFLKDRNNWGDNPTIDMNRPALMSAFSKSKAADLNAAHTATSTQKLQSGGATTPAFTLGPDGKMQLNMPQKPSTGGGRGAPPATPPVTQQTKAPAAPVAPAAPPIRTAQATAPGKAAVGATRVLTQAQVDNLAQRGIHNFRAGQTVTFDGSTWK
jgi:hypothetical protein